MGACSVLVMVIGFIRPLMEQGGCVPHLDHLVQSDISHKNYCYHLEKKRRLIEKA